MSLEPQSPSNPDSRSNPTVNPSLSNRFQHFCTGFILTGIPIGVFVATSVYMTHGSLSQLGLGTLGVAIALPLIGGILATRYPQTIVNSLEKILEAFPF
ncbi:MAG: hypothetical protein F6K36_31130 [Symploca sp. SIO3C6]|nr:hypothetical protein [Symploca sp. SIO3C6]